MASTSDAPDVGQDVSQDIGSMNTSPATIAGAPPLIGQVVQRMVTQLSDRVPDIAQEQADALVEPIRTKLEQYVDDALDVARSALSQQVDDALTPESAYSQRHVDELLDPVTSVLREQLGQTLASLAPENVTHAQDQPSRKGTRKTSRKTSRKQAQTSEQVSEQAPDEDGASAPPARRAKGPATPRATRGRKKEAESSPSRRTRGSRKASEKASEGETSSQSDDGAGLQSGRKRQSRRTKSKTDD